MLRSENITKIAGDLLKAQKAFTSPKKSVNNPFFKSKYADISDVLEACQKALNDNNIVLIQPIVNKEGKNYVQTLLLHNSGEFLGCETEIKVKDNTNPQAEGSGITYARRYGLQSLLCLAADDDDGNEANKEASKPAKNDSQNKINAAINYLKSAKDLESLENLNKKSIKAYPDLENNRQYVECYASLKGELQGGV